MGLNASALNAEYGAHYKQGSQNKQRLRQRLLFGSETDAFFNMISTNDTVFDLANTEQSRVLQPFQKKWSPTGDTTFTPAPIQLRGMKVDVEEYPDELVETWAGFLTSNSLDRKKYPFVAWLIETHILGQKNEDWEMNEVYAGEYLAPPTPGTAGASGTVIDGIKKLVNDAYAGSDIPAGNKLSTGALETDPQLLVEQINDFVARIGERYRNRAPLKLALTQGAEMTYRQGIREKYNMHYDQVKAGNRLVIPDAPNVSLFFLPSMIGEDKIICTRAQNAVMPVKNLVNTSKFRITDNGDRLVKIFTDYSKGIGFPRWDEFWTNDQNLV